MRFFVTLATLGTLAACNTAGTNVGANAGVGVGANTYEEPVDRIASPTEGFENEAGVDE